MIYYITHLFVPFTDSDDTRRESERDVSQVRGRELLQGAAVLVPSRVTPLDVAAERTDIFREMH